MNQLIIFFYMGGYGKYVFSAYALVLAVLSIQFFFALYRWKHQSRKLDNE